MTPKERAAMQQALEALHNTQNALLFVSGSIEQFIISNMTADAHDDADKAITALREALAEQAEQEPVAKIALKNCIYFDSIDFNQTPPYLRYDTGDSTPKENWIIYCDIQEELRKNGYELTDSDVDHDTVCGDVTPMAAAIRNRGAK